MLSDALLCGDDTLCGGTLCGALALALFYAPHAPRIPAAAAGSDPAARVDAAVDAARTVAGLADPPPPPRSEAA